MGEPIIGRDRHSPEPRDVRLHVRCTPHQPPLERTRGKRELTNPHLESTDSPFEVQQEARSLLIRDDAVPIIRILPHRIRNDQALERRVGRMGSKSLIHRFRADDVGELARRSTVERVSNQALRVGRPALPTKGLVEPGREGGDGLR